MDQYRPGLSGRIAALFIGSKLTPLIIIASVLLGAAAVWLLPREEEPQIKVPMIDVMVSMPGSTARACRKAARAAVISPLDRYVRPRL